MPPFNASIPSYNGKQFGAYVARANAKTAPTLIVIQEIFGVNAGLRQMCDDWAKAGYNAICPDLFWRQEAGVELSDKTEAEWARAFELFKGFDVDAGVKDLSATLAYARKMEGSNGKVGSIGFCLGGKMAYLMGVKTDADCNVSYYGVGLDEMLGDIMAIKKPMLIHIAGKDKYVPPEAQMKIRAAASRNNKISTYVYDDADHAFARVNGQHYLESAAKLAASRTTEFLKAHLS